ncbi:MAG: GTP pyrophosphokinase family protein [Lachnospiraceae bacterium]|nr:GTP pyrophosphokinase family protein [Lachnospiraceae bacterium]
MKIQLWREKLDPYAQAVSELVIKLDNTRTEYRRKGIYCPIESVSGRVKEIPSILDKMIRKNISFDTLEAEMEDIAGIRVICQFIEDIPAAVEIIRKRTDIEVVQVKDYLNTKKESGYRSFHLVVRYTVNTMEGPKELPVEIQIRTMAMDTWATSEHFLQYKYKGGLPANVREKMAALSRATDQLDEEMMNVRRDIMDAEINSLLEINLVRDIVTEIENLYRVQNEREAMKIQNEFYRIYKLHDMNELQRFHDELDILSEDNRSQTVNFDSEPRKFEWHV